MGMAASQARFLGLTARKTNVEYQGQQVNQARTALANESSGLFNEMLSLKVPTPPIVNNFYESRYNFDGSALDMKYTISSMTPHVGSDPPTYDVVIDYIKSVLSGFEDSSGTKITIAKGTDNKYYYGDILLKETDDTDKNAINALLENKNLNIPDGQKFYKYVSGSPSRTNYVFMESGNEAEYESFIYYAKNVDKSYQASAIGEFEKDQKTSRLTTAKFDKDSIIPDPNDKTPEATVKDLSGNHDLSISNTYNEQGYNEAMLQYDYQKMLYDNEVERINAKTESIQQQDRTLELKLRQLDTEQKALQTEMDSVQKVIQKNVEVTFKTFA